MAELSPGGLPRRFRVLVAASTFSGVGDGLVAAAMPLLIASQTTSPTVVAGVVAVQRLPWLLFSLHGGALADRADLRRLLPSVDAVRAAVLGLLTIAVVLDAGVVPLTYLTAFVVGTGDTTVNSGLQAAIPRMVPDGKLDRANSAMFLSQSLTEHLMGPAVGGLLFALAMPLPFGLDAVSFAIAALLMARSLPAGPVVAPSGHTMTADIRDAMQWYRRHADLRRLTVLIGSFSLTQAAVLAVLVLLVTDVYGASSSTFGLVLAAAAVGNIVGSFLSERVNRLADIGTVLLLGGAATGLAYAAMGATRSPVVAGGLLAIEGIAVGIVHVASVTYRQRQIPAAMLGRVSAAFRSFVFGAMPVGAILAGLGSEVLGVARTFVVIGLVQLVAALALAPRIRASVVPVGERSPTGERNDPDAVE